MAYYAFLDNNNVVIEVISGVDENELIEGLEPEIWYSNFRGSKCKRTSFNGNIRKNFAGIGFIYDEEKDAFIPPQPYESWVLNENTCNWESLKIQPHIKDIWDEDIQDWRCINCD